MSNKNYARRTVVKLYFKGADISKELSKYLLSLSFTDKEEDETDDIMYIDSAAIITIASVLGALTAIGAVAYKIIKWFQAQEKQTTDIEDLKKQEKEDIKAMEDELCLLTYAVLACLKGLKEQGCNGPVTEAIGKIEKHINQKAHGQET